MTPKNMNIRICTPVVGNTIEVFLNNLEKTQQTSSLLELRIDYVSNISIKNLETIRAATSVPAILTCRASSEGGHFNGLEEDRIAILQSAIGMFEYVDIELTTMHHHHVTRNEKTQLIVSYHNFERTPRYWDMQKIIYDINTFNPDIIKIATMINYDYEVTKIYRLLTNKPKDEERIIVGIGEAGKMTRILGPLLGSYLTYAATPWGESAPGQIQIEELKKVYNTLT
jgi:3-dehydroquinate dehydratase type I